MFPDTAYTDEATVTAEGPLDKCIGNVRGQRLSKESKTGGGTGNLGPQ